MSKFAAGSISARSCLMLIALVVAGRAAAAVPSPVTSTIPTHAVLVGTDANGAADPLGAVTVVVRDPAGTPYPFALVALRFTDCSDFLVSQSQPWPGASASCPRPYGPVVQKVAGPDGVATFAAVGRADRSQPATRTAELEVLADGVRLGTIPVAAYDQDGGGVGATDLALWVADFFSGEYFQRSDYDGDGALGATDLAEWAGAHFAHGSILPGVTNYCP